MLLVSSAALSKMATRVEAESVKQSSLLMHSQITGVFVGSGRKKKSTKKSKSKRKMILKGYDVAFIYLLTSHRHKVGHGVALFFSTQHFVLH